MDDGNSRVFRGLKLVKVVRIVRLLRLFKILRIARFQVIAEEFVEVRIWGRLAIATTWETFLSQSFPPTFASLNKKKGVILCDTESIQRLSALCLPN